MLLKVYKLLMSHKWDKWLVIVAADTEAEARLGFDHIEEVELIPGLLFDPSVARKPVAFNKDGTPMLNVLVYEWYPDN